MNHKKQEFLKSIILSILVLASLLQVGILWGYQSHGLPFNFLSAFFSTMGANSLVDIDKAKGEYFLPYQVIVSEGFDASHWIVARKTDTYNKLWNEAKSYLKDILGSKTEIVPTDELWGDIVTKKAVIFEFKANIKLNLMDFFLDIPNATSNFPSGITKIAILPWDDINDNVNTIYILDDSKVYKCNTPIRDGQMKKDDYKAIIDKLTQDSSQRSYSVIKELIPDGKKALYPIREDILIANETSNIFENYHNISFSTSENLSLSKGSGSCGS